MYLCTLIPKEFNNKTAESTIGENIYWPTLFKQNKKTVWIKETGTGNP